MMYHLQNAATFVSVILKNGGSGNYKPGLWSQTDLSWSLNQYLCGM